jgi:hypothetical protein
MLLTPHTFLKLRGLPISVGKYIGPRLAPMYMNERQPAWSPHRTFTYTVCY